LSAQELVSRRRGASAVGAHASAPTACHGRWRAPIGRQVSSDRNPRFASGRRVAVVDPNVIRDHARLGFSEITRAHPREDPSL
jgi:hypothetical protein